MYYSLHLTNSCNLACSYCDRKKSHEFMSHETALQAVDLALADPDDSVSIGFFGGEPLLCRSLISDVVAYTKNNASNKRVFFRLTTNGLLLDDAFLRQAQQEGILISLSLDGDAKAHDANRKDHNGGGSYNTLQPLLPKLLRQNPYTAAMMTVAPNTAPFLADSVKSIYTLGFVNIVCSLDYKAPWTEVDLAILKKQYKKLAHIYYEMTVSEKKFYLSPFDGKIDSHINCREYCSERCKLGFEQIAVDVDGTLYPCTQFVGDREYQIGSVAAGIDQRRRWDLYEQSLTEHSECMICAIKDRCLHTCSCLNKYTTGHINEPSPVLCAVERMLIPIADSVAAKLFKKRQSMFIQKHYNELYSLISLLEDSEAGDSVIHHNNMRREV